MKITAIKAITAATLILTVILSPLMAHGEARTGILVDADCGARLESEPSEASSHPVSCALDKQESGFGILVDGEFLPFDEFGNKQALLLLKATSRASNLKVRVEGHFEGDVVEVSEIETVE